MILGASAPPLLPTSRYGKTSKTGRIMFSMAPKIVIQNAILRGSQQDGFLQRVAIVYVGDEEYRVFAPDKAAGDALDWLEQFRVHLASKREVNSEMAITDDRKYYMVALVAEELERRKLDGDIWRDGDPNARYYPAQICIQGHIQFRWKGQFHTPKILSTVRC